MSDEPNATTGRAPESCQRKRSSTPVATPSYRAVKHHEHDASEAMSKNSTTQEECTAADAHSEIPAATTEVDAE